MLLILKNFLSNHYKTAHRFNDYVNTEDLICLPLVFYLHHILVEKSRH